MEFDVLFTDMCLSTVMTRPLGPSCTNGSANTWDHCESGEKKSGVMKKNENERKNKREVG